jgi:hypothetical protein
VFLTAQGTFVPDEEELTARPKGALQDSKVSLATPGKFFGGIKGFGFTKANELFAGRLAQLGFAASLIGEGLTGKGILGQLNVEVCLPLLLLLQIVFGALPQETLTCSRAPRCSVHRLSAPYVASCRIRAVKKWFLVHAANLPGGPSR